jgi:hypothetical protein
MKGLLIFLAASALVPLAVAQLAAGVLWKIHAFNAVEKDKVQSWISFYFKQNDPRALVNTACWHVTNTSKSEDLFDEGDMEEWDRGYHPCEDDSVHFTLKKGYMLMVKQFWDTNQSVCTCFGRAAASRCAKC